MVSEFEVSLTRTQSIALILVQLLSPDLVKAILIEERDSELEDSREFHLSLRIKAQAKWKRLDDLCKKKQFYKMNPSIPIMFDIPFSDDLYCLSRMMIKQINYMFLGFIKLYPRWDHYPHAYRGLDPNRRGPWQNQRIDEYYRSTFDLVDRQNIEDINYHKELPLTCIKEKTELLRIIMSDESNYRDPTLKRDVSSSYLLFMELVSKYNETDSSKWGKLDYDDLSSISYNGTEWSVLVW